MGGVTAISGVSFVYASPSMLLAEALQGFIQVRGGCFFFRLRAANLNPSLDNAARWRDAVERRWLPSSRRVHSSPS